ncbi:hypothetical protein ABK040_015064 [Willaertia magna]
MKKVNGNHYNNNNMILEENKLLSEFSLFKFFTIHLIIAIAIYSFIVIGLNTSFPIHSTSTASSSFHDIDIKNNTTILHTNNHLQNNLQNNTLQNTLQNNNIETTMNPTTTNIFIILIDALRYDFYQNLTILHTLQQKFPKKTSFHKFIADPPTTTSQRLKSLMTGTLPTFIESIYNFNSEELNLPNLLENFKNKFGKNINLFGDDTWVSLYGKDCNEIFRKLIVGSSFNVWDLHTLDNLILENIYKEFTIMDENERENVVMENVTESGVDNTLQKSLQKNTQNSLQNSLQKNTQNVPKITITHFLGVDHCGHRYGVYHEEMTNKLNQMNEFIKNITELVTLQDSLQNSLQNNNLQNETLQNNLQNRKNTIFLIFGDHGMNDNGEHGGGSDLEVNSLLFIYSTNLELLQNVDNTLQKSLHEVSQIDIVPTLSILLNIEIPKNNLGKIIPNMLTTEISLQKSIFLNAKQIYNYILNLEIENKLELINLFKNEKYEEFINLKYLIIFLLINLQLLFYHKLLLQSTNETTLQQNVTKVTTFKRVTKNVTKNDTKDTTIKKYNILLDIYLFCNQFYFCLGHQHVMSTIQWNCAFVGIENAHLILSGLLVLLNQFSFKFLFSLSLPYYVTMICVFLQRNHLMIFDIFLPKMLFVNISYLVMSFSFIILQFIIKLLSKEWK